MSFNHFKYHNNLFTLIDCNNFYVSCERAFNPELWKKPVVVLSNNDGNVISRSKEAKQMGIEMGVPIMEIRELMEQKKIYAFSSNYSLYADMSRRVFDTLKQFGYPIETYSIDEAFLLLNEASSINLMELGTIIKKTVWQRTGIPISLGIGKTKTLAKISNKLTKRNSSKEDTFYFQHQDTTDELLKEVGVGDIWGIGFQLVDYLESIGIRTAFDLKYIPEELIRRRFSIKGLRIIMELRGIPCIPLEENPPAKKEIVSSRSFGRPVVSLEDLWEATSLYVTLAVEKLRKQDSYASIIGVFLATNTFKKHEPQYSNSDYVQLPVPSNDITTLLGCAHQSLTKIYKYGFQYKKSGVVLSGFMPRGQTTIDMFLNSNSSKESDSLHHALAEINENHGRNTIHIAAAGISQPWIMRRNFMTQRNTTQWKKALEVKA